MVTRVTFTETLKTAISKLQKIYEKFERILKERPTVLQNLLLLQIIHTFNELVIKNTHVQKIKPLCFYGMASPASWVSLITRK